VGTPNDALFFVAQLSDHCRAVGEYIRRVIASMRPSGPSTTSSSRFPEPFQKGRHTEVPLNSIHSFEPFSGAFSFRTWIFHFP